MIDFDDTAFDLTAMSALKADTHEDHPNHNGPSPSQEDTLDDILKELSLGALDSQDALGNDDWSMPTFDTTFDVFPPSKESKEGVVERIKRQRIVIEQQTDLVPPCVVCIYMLYNHVVDEQDGAYAKDCIG